MVEILIIEDDQVWIDILLDELEIKNEAHREAIRKDIEDLKTLPVT